MSNLIVPTYNDPEDFENDDGIKYPCNTQYMVYNKLRHKYYLTEQALELNGIDVDRKYVSDNPNKRQEFIEKVTKKIYDYIYYKAGWKCYQIMEYRIAKSYGKMYDPYEFRRQFQEVLISQAKYLLTNGDSAEYSINNIEKGVHDKIKPEEDYMNTGDISNEAKRSLAFMGLDRWFSVGQYQKVDKDEY